MKIVVEYEVANHREYCYKNGEQEKCPNLIWSTGQCTVFNQNPEWNCDVQAFRKLPECILSCKI